MALTFSQHTVLEVLCGTKKRVSVFVLSGTFFFHHRYRNLSSVSGMNNATKEMESAILAWKKFALAGSWIGRVLFLRLITSAICEANLHF